MENIKFSIEKKWYKQNGKTCICFIEGVWRCPLPDCDNDNYKKYRDFINTIRKIKYCGIAKCTEDDTFDIIKGNRIAESRAYLKIHKDKVKLLQFNINYHKNKFYNYLIQLGRTNRIQSVENMHLEYLINHENNN